MSARSKREQLEARNSELASKLVAAQDSLRNKLDVIEHQKLEIREMAEKMRQLEDTIRALRGDWVLIHGDQLE
jgi:hypothetical protein